LCLFSKRRLIKLETENSLLRDDKLHQPYNLRRLTAETSGHFLHDGDLSLLPCIRIINDDDLRPVENKAIGAGKFGTCYVKMLSHFKVCVKVIPRLHKRAFTSEANIVSKFAHPNLPFLFGICCGKSLSLVLSYHAIGELAVTLDKSLFNASLAIKRVVADVDWMQILRGLLCGLEHLHLKQKVLHNDLKCDNIILGFNKEIQGIIIDFGKACNISEGKYYALSVKQKERYKCYHSQIAPDLRDGLCKQSVMSDMYSFGRIVATVNECKLKDTALEELTSKCLQYNWSKRPNIDTVKQYI